MVRFAFRLAAALLFCSLTSASLAFGQEPPSPRPAPRYAGEDVGVLTSQLVLPQPSEPKTRRPGALIPLYVSFSVLQVLDSHSTTRALGQGAVEANPVMKGIAGNQAAMLAVKAAGTSGLILASEKMWKRNKAAAIALMVASNAAMAWVVQRNYAAVR